MNQQNDLVSQRKVRIDKADKLQKLGFNPYPNKAEKSCSNQEIVDNYEKFENKEVQVTGRIMTWREHGKIAFGHIQDDSGQIQLFLKSDELAKSSAQKQNYGWDMLKYFDVGDFVGAKGKVTKTKRGEVSVMVEELKLLSKALRPLPSKWHGLKNKETRLRRRYVDMTMNSKVRASLKRRSLFWRMTREFLDKNGFYEINIPVLEHLTGGADAKPFVTHYDALDEDFYLRISHELPLKRLLGGGFEKVYDIGPRFRNEGIGEEHLPEHIAMEFYWAYADYKDGMKLTQELFKYVLKKVFGTLKFSVKGFDINLDKKWPVRDFEELLKKKYGKIDIYNDSVDKLNSVLKSNGGRVEGEVNRNRVVDNLWKIIRSETGGPIFVTGIPKFFSPLSKTSPENEKVVERFFPIIAGTEMANAFSELNDPQDQLKRFVEQQSMRDAGDEEAQMLDIDFVEMLECGMPPAFGLGMSERVFWVFEGLSAREAVPFAQLRYKLEETTKKIYSDILKYIKK